jgi:hypothetical protein
MKKSLLAQISFVALFATLSTAFASTGHGGVSDGGGGTSNPDPVKPESIAFEAEYSGRFVLSWLYRQEQDFMKLSLDARETSPYSKLFGSQKDVFQVMPDVRIELRMSAPCHDANGAPKDASIYGKEAGTLCLSPYSMASKLNSENVERETAALIIHEISHLFGTTEDEAVRIQKDALRDFNRVSFLDEGMNIDMLYAVGLGGDLAQLLLKTRFWFSGDQTQIRHDLTGEDILYFKSEMSHVRNKLDRPMGVLLFARQTSLRAFDPQYTRLNVVADFVCMFDPREDSTVKDECIKRLDNIFQSDAKLTAREIERRSGKDDPGPDFDLVTVKRPKDWDDVRDEILEARNYLIQLSDDARALSQFKFPTYKTE